MKAIIIGSIEGSIIWASETVYLLLQCESGSLIGRGFVEFFESNSDRPLRARLREAAEEHQMVTHPVTFRPEGTKKPIELVFEISPVDHPESKTLLLHIAVSRAPKLRSPRLPGVDVHYGKDSERSFDETYQLSSLSFDDARKLFARLEDAMTEKSLYRDSDLTLAKCSRHLQTNTSYLSHVVNFFAGCTFTQYLNHKRLGYLLRKHPMGEGVSLDRDLIAEAGFGSYHTFYRYVKGRYGRTPMKLLTEPEFEGADG